MNRSKKLGILNLIVFIGTVVVNALANILPINGLTTGELADLYPNLFVPAGITFSIWGLIYVLLGVFTIYQLIVSFKSSLYHTTFVEKIGILNIVLGIGNMLWIFAWHYKYVGISVIIMLSMLISLIIIYKKLKIGKQVKKRMEVLLVHINFSVYLGWISIAAIANITAYLVHIHWNGFGISEEFWTVSVMTLGILLGLLFILLYKDIFYALVIDWAFLGIYLKRTVQDTDPVRSVITTSIIGMIILSFAIIISIFKKRVYTNLKFKN